MSQDWDYVWAVCTPCVIHWLDMALSGARIIESALRH
jgi:hypothetical protein